MRPVTTTLDVLVRDPVNDNAWPGVEEEILFDDAACPAVDGDVPYFKIEQGFVVMGFDASASDSFAAPDGWQYFSNEDAQALIAGWAAADLEWHAATKITCSNNPDNFWIVSNSFFDVQNAFSICCGAPNILTMPFALKQSNKELTPGTQYICGTEAIFRWLVIYGSNETRPNLSARFDIRLTSADESVTLAGPFSSFPIGPTGQISKSWPADFIGMTIDGVNLVANDQEVVMPGEMRVKDFDFGTIEVTTSILDENFDVVQSDTNTWALPTTQCGAGCIDPYPDPLTLPQATEGVLYNENIQLEGDGPFAISIVQKPDELTISLNPATGLVNFFGTFPAFGNDKVIQFRAENCGEVVTEATPLAEILLDVKQVLSFTARTPAANQPWYKVVYAQFLNLWVAISQQGSSGNQVMTSPDGETWTLRTTTGNFNWNDICVNEAGGKLVAVATGDVGAVMTSVDGITWNPFNASELGQWRGVCYSPDLDLYVAVGSLGTNRIMTSPDGEVWTSKVAPVLNNWYSLDWSSSLGLFAAVAITGSGNQIMTSPDGDTWTIRTTPGASRSFFKLKYANGLFVAVSGTGAVAQRVMTSPDAINWTLQNAANSNGAWLGVDFGNDLWVAVANTTAGAEEKAMMSVDTITWQEVVGTPNSPWTSIAYNGTNRFVAVALNAVMTGDWT